MVGKAVRGRARWAVVALLSALVVTGAVAPGARASSSPPGSAAAAGAARHCRTVQVPVTIPGTAPGEVTGDLCQPASGPGRTALLLVAGGGENADYWNEPALPSYSFVKAATAAGYTTFAIDRLGTGRSTLPSSSTLVTYAAQVSTVHQVAQALRADPAVFGHSWRTVAGVGHSLGSGTLAGVAASDPGDLNAMILTGYGAAVSPQTPQLNAIYQKPAATVNPARWGNLDPGYVTVVPAGVLQAGSLYPPDTTRAAAAAAARTQGTLSTTELSTRPQGAAAIAQAAKITTPVLAADGQYDRRATPSARPSPSPPSAPARPPSTPTSGRCCRAPAWPPASWPTAATRSSSRSPRPGPTGSSSPGCTPPCPAGPRTAPCRVPAGRPPRPESDPRAGRPLTAGPR